MNDTASLLELTTDIVSAYVTKNRLPTNELSELIASISDSIRKLGAPALEPEPALVPAINPKRSVHDDYIVCLEDGKKFKSLKRHLMTHYGLTPDQYRQKWNLGPSYPMVAPGYAVIRSQLATKMGLGRKVGAKVKSKSPPAKDAGSPRKAAAKRRNANRP